MRRCVLLFGKRKDNEIKVETVVSFVRFSLQIADKLTHKSNAFVLIYEHKIQIKDGDTE